MIGRDVTEDDLRTATVDRNGQPMLSDGLLRPEPKSESGTADRGSSTFFGLAFAGLALVAIYVSSPVDMPEFPDCPIQTIGSCGQHQ